MPQSYIFLNSKKSTGRAGGFFTVDRLLSYFYLNSKYENACGLLFALLKA
jgi:hypothetical protein